MTDDLIDRLREVCRAIGRYPDVLTAFFIFPKDQPIVEIEIHFNDKYITVVATNEFLLDSVIISEGMAVLFYQKAKNKLDMDSQ